jgi:prophage regulatory protein
MKIPLLRFISYLIEQEFILMNTLPNTGFLRLAAIIGDKKANTPAIIPISRTSWLEGVKSGKYPKPVKLGARSVAWRVEDIRALINGISAQNQQS